MFTRKKNERFSKYGKAKIFKIMTNILESGITLVHPYFRNKSDKFMISKEIIVK